MGALQNKLASVQRHIMPTEMSKLLAQDIKTQAIKFGTEWPRISASFLLVSKLQQDLAKEQGRINKMHRSQ